MISLSKKDHIRLENQGISKQSLAQQIKLLENGTKPVVLVAPAIPYDGIIILGSQQLEQYKGAFDNRSKGIKITRFVPASGAASRMFKSFFQYLESGEEDDDVKLFARNLTSFAFYDQIKCSQQPEVNCAINNMINVAKLADLPKALIPFHQYKEGNRTAFEEHLVEAIQIMGNEKIVNIHFTISEAHQEKFNQLLDENLSKYEFKYGCKIKVQFSYQSSSTNTVALNDKNQLYRTSDKEIVLRPGGHGSLLKNLRELDADLVFIKNIDNVQPDPLKKDTILYKKLLAGYLIELQNKISSYLNSLDTNKFDFDEVIEFAKNDLQIKLSQTFSTLADVEQVQFLKSKLNRPIRICGMVKNEGEPGGGPFWVGNNGEVSLQIVETSQIDFDNPKQAEIVQAATHFNPVDLVCWLKDYQGKKFDLTKFSDRDTSFIAEKSQNGEKIKVLEHPGLWNGAMADWITIFVEVPVSTFSPVKTITDLLRIEHQKP